MSSKRKKSETPAEGGANNIGCCGSDHLPAFKSDEATTVVEPPLPDDFPAAAGSDVRLIDTSQMLSDAATQVARLESEKAQVQANLDSIYSGLVKFCGIVHQLVGESKYPVNLYECELLLREEIDRLREENITLKTLNKAMPGFGASYESQTKRKRYLVSDSYLIMDHQEEAEKHALTSAMESGQPVILAVISDAKQVQVQPIWEVV